MYTHLSSSPACLASCHNWGQNMDLSSHVIDLGGNLFDFFVAAVEGKPERLQWLTRKSVEWDPKWKNDGSEEEKTSNEDHWPAVVSTTPSAFSI